MIENIEIRAFLRDNISFCRTIVIKYEDLAIMDNRLISRFYQTTISNDKTTWRYYMNLNGEYHFSDDMMSVRSLDDQTTIDFTKENLENHPATKSAYRLGGYYYSRLVDQYPHQRDLINGIINPIPKDEAISAKDFQILRYTTEYVLWNEAQLIPALQKWIDNVGYQIFSTEYKYTENLMYPAMLSFLHESLIKQTIAIRYENRGTRYAHSFFIWSKLESEGISPIYKDLLNQKQTMWLFRNIDYVLHNLGKENTFNQLMDVLLTERDIPLSKYDMVYDTTEMPESLVPQAKYLTTRLNMTERLGLAESLRDISITMTKEIPDALNNEVMYDKYLASTTDETNFGVASNYPIKILESEMVDTSNRQPETFYHVLNAELIYLAKHDLYDIQIDFTEQISGNQHMLNVSECILVWHHLLFKYLGWDIEDIPELEYHKALKVKPPTIEELMSLGGHPLLERDWCTDLYKSHIPQFRIISPTAFHENAKAIFDLKWKHKKMAARFPSIGYHSRRSNATSDMYETGFAKLGNYKTFSELLVKYGLSFDTYTKDDCLVMMWEIWRKMTGWDQFTHQTIAQIQSGMISLMKFLSSYSLQFIKQIEVQDGWFQGGLDLLTENPMNLRDTGPMPELESELDTNLIPVHLRVVTHNEFDMSFIGTIEETGFFLDAETDNVAKVFETPLLYSSEDQDSVFEMNGGHDNILRETDNIPWDLDDLIPVGTSSPQFTNGMVIDTFVGEIQAGPWRAVGVEIVDNGLDNEIVTNKISGISVDSYAEFQEVPDLNSSGANSPKSIGASFVNNKAHYDVGFIPAHTGDGVVKFNLIAEHEDTGEQIKIRFEYDVTVNNHTWMNTLEIPESVVLDEEFPITPTMNGLDVNGDTVESISFKLADGLDEWLTIRQDDTGNLFGTFTKTGWPKNLYALTAVKIKPTDQPEGSNTGDRYRYMVGLVPSDRYYDPLLDPDFSGVGKWEMGEGDINAMTLDTFTFIAEKKGWTVAGITVQDTERNKSTIGKDYVTNYGTLKNYITPTPAPTTYTTVDGVKYIKLGVWWASLQLGKNEIDLSTVIINDKTKQRLYVNWVYTPTTYDHGIKTTYAVGPNYRQFPKGIEITTPIAIYNPITIVNLDVRIDIIENDATNPLTIPSGRISASSAGVSGFKVKSTGPISKDIGFGIQMRVYPKTNDGTKSLYCRHYGHFVIEKDWVFDPNDFNVEELGFEPLEVNQWAVNKFIQDKVLTRGNVKGWSASIVEYATDDNGNILTEGVRTKYSRGSEIYDIGFPIPNIKGVTQPNEKIQFPEKYKAGKYFGVGLVPTVAGELTIKLKVTLNNIWLRSLTRIEYVDYKVNVALSDYKLIIDPTVIIKKGVKTLNYKIEGLPKETYQRDGDEILTPGLSSYSTSTMSIADWAGEITVPELDRNSTDSPGIGIVVRAMYHDYNRTNVDKVGYYRYYEAFAEINAEDILEQYPPKLEDFNFTAQNVDFYQNATSCETFTFAKKDRYGWVINKVELEVADTDDEANYINREYHGLAREQMYHSGDIISGADSNTSTLMFTPNKLGSQTLNLKLTLTNPDSTTIETLTIPYSFNVKEQDITSSIGVERYFPIGASVSTPVAFNNIPNGDTSFSLYNVLVGLDDNISDYLYVDSLLKNGAKITVKQAPSEGKKLYLVVMTVRKDPSQTSIVEFKDGTRIYYSKLEIPNNFIYSQDDISLDDFDLQNDIVFNDRFKNEVRTERYSYLQSYRGWKFSEVSLAEVPDSLLGTLTYDGETTTIPDTNDCIINSNYDLVETNKAPDNKWFMFSKLGFNQTGEQSVKYKIDLVGIYHNATKSVYLDVKRNVGDSAFVIGLDTTNKFSVGTDNTVSLLETNIPSEGTPDWVTKSTTTAIFIGKNVDALTFIPDLNSLNIDEVLYDGSPSLFVGFVNYTSEAAVSQENRSLTDSRGYLGTTEITSDNFIIPSLNLAISKVGVVRPISRLLLNDRIWISSSYNNWEPTGLEIDLETEEDYEKHFIRSHNEIDLKYATTTYDGVNYGDFTIDGVSKRLFNFGFIPRDDAVGGDPFPLKFELTHKVSGNKIYVPYDYYFTGNVGRDWNSPTILTSNTRGFEIGTAVTAEPTISNIITNNISHITTSLIYFKEEDQNKVRVNSVYNSLSVWYNWSITPLVMFDSPINGSYVASGTFKYQASYAPEANDNYLRVGFICDVTFSNTQLTDFRNYDWSSIEFNPVAVDEVGYVGEGAHFVWKYATHKPFGLMSYAFSFTDSATMARFNNYVVKDGISINRPYGSFSNSGEYGNLKGYLIIPNEVRDEQITLTNNFRALNGTSSGGVDKIWNLSVKPKRFSLSVVSVKLSPGYTNRLDVVLESSNLPVPTNKFSFLRARSFLPIGNATSKIRSANATSNGSTINLQITFIRDVAVGKYSLLMNAVYAEDNDVVISNELDKIETYSDTIEIEVTGSALV